MKHVRTLEQFDGDLLTQVISDKGVTFVKKWADTATWIVAETTTKRIAAYLNKKISMYDLMFEFNSSILVYNEKDDTYISTKVSEIPSSYMCSKDAYHDEDLRAEEWENI